MQIVQHQIAQFQVAELQLSTTLFQTADEAFQCMIDLYYQGYDCIVVEQKHLPSDFFKLENKMAGEILQKFVNYRMKLIVLGNFLIYKQRSTQDFIHESNRGNTAFFLTNWEDIPRVLSAL